MYSEQTSTSSYSRVAAAALLAVSAGACVGVALAPAASSLYAPAAVRPITGQVSLVTVPRVQRQAVNVPYGAEYAAAEMQTPAVQTPAVSGWTILSGGLFAAAAALIAVAFKGTRVETSEQIAMLATLGKKGAKKAPAAKETRPLWFPSAVAPDYLDGSLPGDRGFDPFGIAAPRVYYQWDDGTYDPNATQNREPQIIGISPYRPDIVTDTPLKPYSEVYGIKRLRECELIHGRWCMLFVLGALVGEAATGVAWQNAGLVEAKEGFSYLGYPLPWSGTQVTAFEIFAVGFAEVYRNTELNVDKRPYPGGAFDPLGLASKDSETTFRLKEAEIKHARLAMVAFLGFAAAAAKTGAGATTAFSIFASSFN